MWKRIRPWVDVLAGEFPYADWFMIELGTSAKTDTETGVDILSLQMNEENEQYFRNCQENLEIMEYDTPYKRKTLMEKLGLKSRDGFRRNYLNPHLR